MGQEPLGFPTVGNCSLLHCLPPGPARLTLGPLLCSCPSPPQLMCTPTFHMEGVSWPPHVSGSLTERAGLSGAVCAGADSSPCRLWGRDCCPPKRTLDCRQKPQLTSETEPAPWLDSHRGSPGPAGSRGQKLKPVA